MEFQKFVNFLDKTSDDNNLPRFVTKKWIELYDQSEGNYNLNKEIRIKTSMLRPDLCDFNDAYIVVKGTITVVRPSDAKGNKVVAFKNNAPFINCISKINGVKMIMQKIWMLQCQCIIYLNTVKITKKKQ